MRFEVEAETATMRVVPTKGEELVMLANRFGLVRNGDCLTLVRKDDTPLEGAEEYFILETPPKSAAPTPEPEPEEAFTEDTE